MVMLTAPTTSVLPPTHAPISALQTQIALLASSVPTVLSLSSIVDFRYAKTPRVALQPAPREACLEWA